LNEKKAQGRQVKPVFVGKKVNELIRSRLGVEAYHFEEFGAKVTFKRASDLAKKLLPLFEQGEVDEVIFVFNEFKNAISPLSVKIPDIHLKDIGKSSNGATIGQVAKILLKEISDKARQIDITQFGAGALRQVGGQLGIDAEQLIKGREAEVDQLRGLLGGR
jgi:hypothetical protein